MSGVSNRLEPGEAAAVLVFDDSTGRLVEVDWRGTPEEVRARLEAPSESTGTEAPERRGPGRPRLGVVAREITLLPRHWSWLKSQPGGASATLRRLVDQARRVHASQDTVRHSQEVAYRFMTALGGDLPGFEEATRALFAGSRESFESSVAAWPKDFRAYAMRLAAAALERD